MTTSFKWNVENLDCLEVAPGTNLPNCVYDIHWTCTGTDDRINPITNMPYQQTAYGTQRVTYDPTELYVPYENLTHEQVLSWLFEILNGIPESTVSSIEQAISAQIQLQITPEIIKPALPW
jgi:hypothetical protein